MASLRYLLMATTLATLTGCTWVTHREWVEPWTEGYPSRIETEKRLTFAQAIRLGDTDEIYRFLVDTQALVRKTEDAVPLYWAIWSGRADIVEILLKRGAIPNVAAPNGLGLLSYAVCESDVKIVELLLHYKADINGFDDRGRTPLHHACIAHSADIAALLVQHGADVNVKDFDGLTPLDITRGADDKITAMLMEHDAVLGHPRQPSTLSAPESTQCSAQLIDRLVKELQTSEKIRVTEINTDVGRGKTGLQTAQELQRAGAFSLAAVVLDVRTDCLNGTAVTISWPLGVPQTARMDFASVLPLNLNGQEIQQVRRGDVIVVCGKPQLFYGAWNTPYRTLPVVRVVRDWSSYETYPRRWSLAEDSYIIALTDVKWKVEHSSGEKAPELALFGTGMPLEVSAQRSRYIYPQQPLEPLPYLPTTSSGMILIPGTKPAKMPEPMNVPAPTTKPAGDATPSAAPAAPASTTPPAPAPKAPAGPTVIPATATK